MALTTAQLQALKAAIVADNALNSQPMNDDGAFAIQDALKATASPDFYIWKAPGEVTRGEILGNGYDWPRVDNLTVGKARIWDQMMLVIDLGQLAMAQANVRAGVNAAFDGSADANMRASIFGHHQRLANRGERIFSTGTGTSTTNTGTGPGTTTVYGVISIADIKAARALQ